MKILSLFDGISCGRVALERAGIKVDKYFASEIDKYAIQVAKKNYPDTIHIGSVTDIKYFDGHIYGPSLCIEHKDALIDMIIGGSPCQDLSIAKKDGKGLQGEKSGLFFEYVRLLKEVKPKYFLLENVASMKKADKEEITRILGVEPVMINSALVSAQNRKRLYWFGQNRKREYNKDILCKYCFYEKRGIQTEASGERIEEVLGEAQEGQENLQNMLSGISENGEKMNSSNLQGGMRESKQEREGQKISTEKQNEDTGTSTRVQKNRGMEKLEGGVQENGQMQEFHEKGGRKTGEKNNESNENSRTTGYNLTEEETVNGRGYGDSEYEEILCCVQCGKKLIHRPYNTTITRWNERTRQFTDSMQELQFTETRQDDGRIFDTYTIGVKQPEDRGIVLKDILEHEVDEKYYLSPEAYEKLKVFESNARLSDINGKVGALSTMQGGHRQPKIQVLGNIHPSGNGMNGIVYGTDGKAPTVSTNKGEGSKIILENRIRKLTPIECERLQTLPDNWTEGISNTQRYKAIGNGWTVDVIAHIFSYIK